MELDDYKEIISLYQQKSFDLFNENIVLRSQINSITKKIETLSKENKILFQELEKSQSLVKDLKDQSTKNQTPKRKVTSTENVDY